ncbi:unnamed protein product [Litomosoides sigmodontis]|uniref:Uncharacterized protein n=1 Tax=Litomosoides sigmodontis TaxID=42156 RepID=A0A3P6SII1_LITSI|nr:unnamed protein product [Litomosoides sigmodontis]
MWLKKLPAYSNSNTLKPLEKSLSNFNPEMDDSKEYLSIKYKIRLKKTSSLSPFSVRSSQLSERQRSFQTKTAQHDPDKSDETANTQQYLYSKYKMVPTSQQPNPVLIRTSSIGTQVGLTESFSKSSEMDYFRDIDPCSNCSSLLLWAAEFLTKIELNCGQPTTSLTNLSSSDRYTPLTERPLKNKRRVARRSMRKEDNIVINTPIPAFNNKDVLMRPPRRATANDSTDVFQHLLLHRHQRYLTQNDKSNRNLINKQRKTAKDLEGQNAAQLEEDSTPLEWILSSKQENEKRKSAMKQIEMGKSEEKKKAENDNNILKKEMNIKLGSTENRENGQVRRNAVAENSSMTSYTEGVMRPEKNIEAVAAATLKLKDVPTSGERTTGYKEKVTVVKSRQEGDKSYVR